MSHFAPLSLAPAFSQPAQQQAPAVDSAFTGAGSFNPGFATSNMYSLDNAFPSYFSPGSPLEHHASPASSAGELLNQPSDRESSPASSFLPTPAGSPKINHAEVQINNIEQQQQWSSLDYSAELNASFGGKPVIAPAQHSSYSMPAPFQAAQPQPIYQNTMVYPQQPQYYSQPPQQQPIQPSTFYLPNQHQSIMPQLPSFGMAMAPQPQFAPSYETPQGTYYFVPASVMPVSSTLPMPAMMAPSPPMSVNSAESWDQLASIPLPPVEPLVALEETKPVVKVAAKKSASKKKNTTKRFLCPHPGCGRAFARNFNLGSHVKSHLGIRDFNCPQCPKKFSRRHDRARHCAAVHDLHHIVEEQDVDNECEA